MNVLLSRIFKKLFFRKIDYFIYSKTGFSYIGKFRSCNFKSPGSIYSRINCYAAPVIRHFNAVTQGSFLNCCRFYNSAYGSQRKIFLNGKSMRSNFFCINGKTGNSGKSNVIGNTHVKAKWMNNSQCSAFCHNIHSKFHIWSNFFTCYINNNRFTYKSSVRNNNSKV